MDLQEDSSDIVLKADEEIYDQLPPSKLLSVNKFVLFESQKETWNQIKSVRTKYDWHAVIALTDPTLITFNLLYNNFEIPDDEALPLIATALDKMVESVYDSHQGQIIQKCSTLKFINSLGQCAPLFHNFYYNVIKFKYHLLTKENVSSIKFYAKNHAQGKKLSELLRTNNYLSHDSVFPTVKTPTSIKNNGSYYEKQFLLLKEDFQMSYEEAVKALKNKTGIKDHFHNYGVVLIEGIATNIFKIRITNRKHLNSINWEKSKQLLNGSLIIVSNNEFTSFIVGIVQNSDDFKNNKSDQITASFPINVPILNRKEKYLMLELSTFYSPFYNVMEKLRLKPNYFFLEKYIIHNLTEIEAPVYIKNNPIMKIFDKELNILKDDLPNSSILNENQSKCLKHVLSNEIALIQGPPGTGKTFMCKQIIQVLLNNKEKWSNEFNTPILVVCMKNKSLDDLLLGCLDLNIQVLRIGRGTKSVELAQYYNLAGINNSQNGWIGDLMRDLAINEIKPIKRELARCIMTCYACQEFNQIVQFDSLKEVVPKNLKQYLKSNFLVWLEPELDLKKYVTTKETSIDILSCLHKKEKIFEMTQQGSDKIEEIKNDLAKVEEDLNNIKFYNHQDCNCKDLENKRAHTQRERWLLYSHWCGEIVAKNQKRFPELLQTYGKIDSRLNELKNLRDFQKIVESNIDVIGVTTTGAARLYKLWEHLKPRIVVIEEAAEVLESHFVASVSAHCKHLIIMGDHKQLQPIVKNQKMIEKYNYNISLFERLLNNGLPCIALQKQYRMRPQICQLISPSIYDNLESDICTNYPNVKGLKNNLFFINHDNLETQDEITMSYYNEFEANFCLALADYLVKQGYEPDEISILATYSAQEIFLLEKRDTYYENLSEVQISTADAYQGKENKIIILSLVRNNDDGNIGFLEKDNRVCVALSRAQHGLYIFGRMNILRKSSKLWGQVEKVLVSQKAIGQNITLKCKIHNVTTSAASAYYIKQLENGGCAEQCSELLDCGHICTHMCHPLDREHDILFKCRTICRQKLPCKHFCYLPCHESSSEHSCNDICNHIMPCGHACPAVCHSATVEHDCLDCRQANMELEKYAREMEAILSQLKFNTQKTSISLKNAIKNEMDFEFLMKLLFKMSHEDPNLMHNIAKVLDNIKEIKIDIGGFLKKFETLLVDRLKETFTKIMKCGNESDEEISLVELTLLIGELLVLGVIKLSVIHSIIKSFINTGSEDCIIALCSLLKSKGKFIYEEDKAKEALLVNMLFEFSKTSKSGALINSVLELKANNWNPIDPQDDIPQLNQDFSEFCVETDDLENQEYEEEITSEEFCIRVKSILDGLTSNSITETSSLLTNFINDDSFLSIVSLTLSKAHYDMYRMENYAKLFFEIIALDPAYEKMLLTKLYRCLEENFIKNEAEIGLTPLVLLFGELYAIHIVSKPVINHIIESCLNDREECLEALCSLFISKGREISFKNIKPINDQVEKLNNIAQSNLEMSYPLRMMIEEVIKIRNNNWISSKENPKAEWNKVQTKKDKKKIKEVETAKVAIDNKRQKIAPLPFTTETYIEPSAEKLFSFQDDKLIYCDNHIQNSWLSGSKSLIQNTQPNPICSVKEKIKIETISNIIEDWLKDQNKDLLKSKMELFPGDTVEIFISQSLLMLKTELDFKKFGQLTILLKKLNIIEPIAVTKFVTNYEHLSPFFPHFFEPLLAEGLITLEFVSTLNCCTVSLFSKIVNLLIQSKGVAWAAKQWSTLVQCDAFKSKGLNLELNM